MSTVTNSTCPVSLPWRTQTKQALKDASDTLIDSTKPPISVFLKTTSSVLIHASATAGKKVIQEVVTAQCPSISSQVNKALEVCPATTTVYLGKKIHPQVESCVETTGNAAKKAMHKAIDVGVDMCVCCPSLFKK